MSEVGPIYICEPQCSAQEHATVNAALLRAMLIAFPESRMVFFGKKDHAVWVKTALESQPEAVDGRVEWESISIPPRHALGYQRLKHEFRWCHAILDAAKQGRPEVVVISSISETGLLALKIATFSQKPAFPILAIFHSVLYTIRIKQSLLPWRRGIWLRDVLRLPTSRSLTYVDLGAPIHARLISIMPAVAKRFHTIDLPYLWAKNRFETLDKAPRQIRFGYFGVRYDGLEDFARLAEEIKNKGYKAEFTQIGFLRDQKTMDYYTSRLSDPLKEPLSFREYAARADTIHYAIWAGDPDYFGLVASSSFLDALSFLKPGIYLRNPFIEHYFQKMGNIGYLCNTYEEIRARILEILHCFPTKEYTEQQERILQKRGLFDASNLAVRLRMLYEESRSRLGMIS